MRARDFRLVLTTMSEPDPLARFHPAARSWFEARFDAPTPAQARGWEAIRRREHTLIAAPTGSGKTLAAFLNVLDELLAEGVAAGGLPDEVRVVYVSPLKALSADIHRNLEAPREGIREIAEGMGLPSVKVTAAVRSGDTPPSERRRMVKTPPHILVTTPESLYLLLTAPRSREILRTVRTVIIDEIHAVLDSRRGTHLALTLERLEHVTRAPLVRVGLSATQKPVEEVARFLVGAPGIRPNGTPRCTIVDEGHLREIDLGLELPGSPLEAVMSHEVWAEVYERLVRRIQEHRTTIVFVNTRRLAERTARDLEARLGEDAVTAHHGSLSKEIRQQAERRLKAGELRALVATASLELGIDIGHVDLVCQIGSPHRIATLLQRVGRSGHTVHGTPKGRLFPLTREDLVESAALLWSVRRGELDRVAVMGKRIDLLAQQIVAEVACEEWEEEALFDLVRRAYPYRALGRAEFSEVVEMVSRGFSTRRGRRGALVHRDGVNHRLRGRKGARLAAITCGGAIPDQADYRVVLEPEGHTVGTVDEDFAIESIPGDIFQLGNTSWRLLRIETGTVRVEDARGEPPNMPFWFGESPDRSSELSAAVANLRREVEVRLDAGEGAAAWLISETGVPDAAARQIARFLGEGKHILGVLPTHDTLIIERFFDDSGSQQLVLHAPFGSRVNRAWGLALRKRFCRQFNFELQAVATHEGVLLSLGPQHSFPLEDVFRYLHPGSVREILIQALLDAPMFQVRWRWAAYLSLALLRWRGGSRTPPQIQRMESEDLLSAVFPDANACLETIVGDREVPDHPLVRQAVADCLDEVMDVTRLEAILARIHAGDVRLIARDTPEPSPLAHELLTARPYAFLDDAPLEERRAHAVHRRRAFEPSSARELGTLDPEAIERVRGEAWPAAESPDELHDALLVSGFLTAAEIGRGGEAWARHLEELAAGGRVQRVDRTGPGARSIRVWVATERISEIQALAGSDERPAAARELLRGRLEITGPTTVRELAASIGIREPEALTALHELEGDGFVLRGSFTPEGEAQEWCERRLLARIHRYTLNRLRAEIEPVTAADLMRFLFRWQRVVPGEQVTGAEGLASVIAILNGFELPAAAWEPDVLQARCENYSPEFLDQLCLTGQVVWGRLQPPRNGGIGLRATGPLRSSPMALFLRESAPGWLRLCERPREHPLSSTATALLAVLEQRGASFFGDLVAETRLLPAQVEGALGELAAVGQLTSDGFSGLRALLTPSDRRKRLPQRGERNGTRRRRRQRAVPYGVDTAGRWSLLPRGGPGPITETDPPSGTEGARARSNPTHDAVVQLAWTLLRRYGVVFRQLLAREAVAVPWRELILVYRRLEARGEIRGGRFVGGFSGEQFALPEAVTLLRKTRASRPTGDVLVISAADPLNLTGLITRGERIAALAGTRIGYRDGVPAYVLEGGRLRSLDPEGAPPEPAVKREMTSRRVLPALRGYVGTRA